MTTLWRGLAWKLINSAQRLARHVMGVHLNAEQPVSQGDLDVAFYKKYIQFARK